MSERAGRGEVRVKPHLLDQYRPTHKPCSSRNSVAISEPQSVIHLLVLFCGRCRWAFPRASRKASQDLSQGPSGLSGSFQNPPQPLPGLAGLQGFQAKPLQTAPWDLSGLESTSNLIEPRGGYDRHAGRPAFGFARPPLRFA